MKKTFILGVLICLCLSFTVCSAYSPTAQNDSDVHPYAWLGLQDLPQCNYFDLVAGQHFVRVIDFYMGPLVSERTMAEDGLNSYTLAEGTIALNIDGMVYSFNPDSKLYTTFDMTDLREDQLAQRAEDVEKGINESGRVYQGTGTSVIPVYSDSTGDTAEYDYYEYLIENSGEGYEMALTERFFFKDGDVFAISSHMKVGENELDYAEVIKSISGDIPEDLIALPEDFAEYTLYE